MAKKYTHDIIVIGAGSGGLTCAMFMKRAGFSVLLIDKTADSFGGDCLNHGCVPSKSLLHAAHRVHTAGVSPFMRGGTVGEINMPAVMDYVRQRQDIIRAHENPDYFNSLGIDIAIGSAEFSGRHQVSVSDETYSGKRIVIATGSSPKRVPVPGLETVPHYDNENIFSISQLPKEFVFIGGGPIAVELGQAFSRLGSQVTIVQAGPRILEKEDEDVSAVMQTLLEREGVTIITKSRLKAIKNGVAVLDTSQQIPVDAVFLAVGRTPNTAGLQLDIAGVKTDAFGKITLDKSLRTSNKAVSVVGDAAGKHMFTHAAEMQAQTVLRSFFSPLKPRYKDAAMAWTTFSDPEISSFGRSKQQLNDERTNFKEITVSLTDDDRAITMDSTDGFLKLFVSPKGTILGGTMIGMRAGEVASEVLLMMHANIRLPKVLDKLYPYPVASRVIQNAARQFSGNRLESPINKLLLKWLFH
jgi:pyruvate/2-oxoglutarate dehydrogenase complex dihydrolipoamide dehydrogenase (E3) component